MPWDAGDRAVPAGRRIPATVRRWDFDGTPGREVPTAAALPSARDLPPPGDQAGRCRGRHVPVGQLVLPRRRSGGSSSTTTRSPPVTPRCRPRCSRSWPPSSDSPRTGWSTSSNPRWSTCSTFPGTCATGCTSPLPVEPGWRWCNGFGGFRDHDGDLRFQPVIPSGWETSHSRSDSTASVVEVRATHDQVTYPSLKGPGRSYSTGTNRSCSNREHRRHDEIRDARNCRGSRAAHRPSIGTDAGLCRDRHRYRDTGGSFLLISCLSHISPINWSLPE